MTTQNVGGIDRALRTILGALLLGGGALVSYMGYRVTITMAIVLGSLMVVGAIFLLTAAVRYCPINQLLNINTCGMDHAEDEPESTRAEKA